MNYDEPDPPRVHYGFKPKEHPRLSEKDKAEHPEPIEVKEILRENMAAEAARLAARTPPPVWRSRRTRDYLLLLTIPNAILAAIIYLLPRNPVVMTFGVSLIVFYALAVTWLMWVVMDRD